MGWSRWGIPPSNSRLNRMINQPMEWTFQTRPYYHGVQALVVKVRTYSIWDTLNYQLYHQTYWSLQGLNRNLGFGRSHKVHFMNNSGCTPKLLNSTKPHSRKSPFSPSSRWQPPFRWLKGVIQWTSHPCDTGIKNHRNFNPQGLNTAFSIYGTLW